MIAGLFPAHIDNTFRGRRIALYAFYPVTALILWRSLHHLIAADGGAQTIATMPLDSYPPGAAQNIVAIFALWGLSQLLLGLVFLIACFRYRAMIPLMWLLLALETAGRQLAGTAKPIVTLHTAPGAAGNLPMLAIALVMLCLSLTPPKDGKDQR
ncbi:MAG: hypothetical protein ACKOQM_11655 [Novosphingobium sp.]